MRTNAIDDPGICQFVCHVGRLCKIAERIDFLFGLGTPVVKEREFMLQCGVCQITLAACYYHSHKVTWLCVPRRLSLSVLCIMYSMSYNCRQLWPRNFIFGKLIKFAHPLASSAMGHWFLPRLPTVSFSAQDLKSV